MAILDNDMTVLGAVTTVLDDMTFLGAIMALLDDTTILQYSPSLIGTRMPAIFLANLQFNLILFIFYHVFAKSQIPQIFLSNRCILAYKPNSSRLNNNIVCLTRNRHDMDKTL